MKKCDRLDNSSFISRYFAVPESVREGLKNIPKCLTAIPMVDQAVGLIGREEILEKILTLHEGGKRLALVSGLGGIGKTAVMQWVCNDIKEKGNYVAWIDCGSSLKEELLLLGDAFGIHDEESDTVYKKILSAVKTLLDGALYLFEPNRAPARCLSNFCIIIEGCPSPGQSFFVLFPCFHLTAQMRSILFSNPVFSFTLVKTT